MEKVLITVGSGLIGQHLGRMLLKNGYHVVVLSRHRNKNIDTDIPVYNWDIDNQIDIWRDVNNASKWQQGIIRKDRGRRL